MVRMLTDLIEPASFSERVRRLSESLGAAVGIVERDGVPLVSSGQALVCRDFLCVARESSQACEAHSRGLCARASVAPVDAVCPNGLCEVGVPVSVGGETLGAVVIGPYARVQAPADLDLAEAWAEANGLDPQAYAAALALVPPYDEARSGQARAAAELLASEVGAAAQRALAQTLPRSADSGEPAQRGAAAGHGEPALRDVLDAIDELLVIADLDTLCRRAVEVARERLGVERIGLFLREGTGLRGTYGTSFGGDIVDESEHVESGGVLVEMGRPGHRGWRTADTDLFVTAGDQRQWIGTNWIGVTPMVVEGESIGVLSNDAAISRSAIDPALQDRLAVYASLLGPLIVRLRNEAALKVFGRLSAALAAADSVLEVAEAATSATEDLFGWDAFFMAVRSADGLRMELPFVIDTVDGERVRYGRRLLPPDFYQSRLPDVVAGMPKLINRDPEADTTTFSPIGASDQISASIIYVPIIAAGEFAGVVSVQSYTPSKYDQSDVRRLVRVAEALAPALGRAYAGERLRHLQAHQQALLDATPDPYLVFDRDARWVAIHAPERLRLYRAEELIGSSVFDVFDQETAARTLETVRRTIDEQCCLTMEYRLERGGRVVWFEGRTAPMGELCAWLARDITQRRQAEDEQRELEEQLRQATKMEAIGQLAGGVAHDFNNLLTTVTGYADLLRDALRGSELERDVEEVLKASERASTLTRQLLAFSRRQVFRREVFDLSDAVLELNGMLSRLIGADIELVADVCPTPLPVSADRGQIEQVIVNLAVNARDAMAHGGRLVLRTLSRELLSEAVRAWPEVDPGEYVALEVTDTGCGMDEETLSHVFEPFFTTKPRGSGTGLGLSTVYGIVHQSAGHVLCESEPGRGTTFTVFLPRAAQTAPDVAACRDDAPPAGGLETVLLAEDEPAVRSLARRVLVSAGYHVIEAVDGHDALRLAESAPTPIDLLVTDVMMPGLNGQELAKRLTEARPELPVLYISGYSEAVLSRRGALDEGTQLLAKPFSPRVLLTRVRAMLDQRA